MTPLAQCLPVRLIPEQLAVTLVRNDVVDHCGHADPAEALAFSAERMPIQKLLSCHAPFVVVSASNGGLAPVFHFSALPRFMLGKSIRPVDGAKTESVWMKKQ